MFFQKVKKVIIHTLLTFFIIFNLNFFILPIPTAKAQDTGLSGFIVVAFTKVMEAMKWTKDRIFDFVKYEATTNALQMFSRKFAQQLATDLASGGQGGKPLFYTRPIKDYINEAGQAAAGDFIGSLSDISWGVLGLNLCDPDINIKLKIQAAFLMEEQPVQPKCDWKQVEQNWSEFQAKMQGGGWMDYVSFSFEPGKSDLEMFLTLRDAKEKKKFEEEKAAEIKRLKTDWEGVTSKITNVIQTPADIIEEQAKGLVSKWSDTQQSIDTAKNVGAYLGKNIFAPFLSQFTNTLVAKLGERFLKQGFWTLSDIAGGGGGGTAGGAGGSEYFSGGYTPAQVAASFAELLTPTINTITNFQQLEDFITCNPGEQTIGNKLNNCVLNQGFYSAITQEPPLSLQEAINLGLIDGNLELISPNDSHNQDQVYCWQSALCYGNLQKLRQARIIPIGWEIAAAKASTTPVTLKTVMDNFNNEGTWYHLIDPNWILKAPAAQCSANVSGPTLETSQGSSRASTCVDAPTCIKTKDDGTCETAAYGYCTKESNIWRLGGDQCDAQYDTCETLTNTSDNSVSSLVKSSMESCNPDAAGCLWYATTQEKTIVSGQDQWQWQDSPRLYFNRQVDDCSSQDAGCSQFIRTVSGTNLIYNGDFEIDEDNNNKPDGWDPTGIVDYSNTGLNGSKAVLNVGGDTINNSEIQILPYEYYTISGWAKPLNTDEPPVIEIINLGGQSVGEIFSYYGASTVSGNDNLKIIADTSANAPNTNGWYFLSLTFLSNVNETTPFSIKIELSAQPIQGNEPAQAWFDNIQLEHSQTPTNYYDYGQVNLTYLQKAPDYYNCQGYTKRVPFYVTESTCEAAGFFWRTDIGACVQSGDNSCANYALYCQAEEVGCQLYEPANGDPEIPGIAKAEDFCPAECVGYQTYEEDANYFDLIEDPLTTSQSQNLIAETAQTCSVAELNCEEFTNLDEVAQGGEGKEYYTYIRQCVLPEENVTNPQYTVDTYYTWEGSDTTGYQLKTWNLLESDLDNGPCTNASLDVELINMSCVDYELNNQQICDPAVNNPNCREFFGLDGTSYFRLQDRTITASEDCRPFRRTVTNTLYNAIPEEGTSCSAQSAGCRQYRGNTSSNIRVVFSDDFEDGDTAGWEFGTISNESVYLFGHSIKSANSILYTTPEPEFIAENLDLINGKDYQLILITKKAGSGSLTINPKIINGTTGDELDFGQVVVTDDWQQLTLGPVTLEHEIDDNDEYLDINPLTSDLFIDQIILKELNNNLYLIRDSWQTPVSCDNPVNNPLGEATISGVTTTGNRTFIGAMLNCQEYQDTNNNTVYLHSFTNLCSEEVVGCEAMINTYNSNSPFEEEFNTNNLDPTGNPITIDDLIVPADDYIYLVNDEDKSCFSSEKGCQKLGQPEINQSTNPDYIVENYETVNLINDPEKYNTTLCVDEQLFCQEYQNSQNSLFYFYDSGERLCEYQINKMVGTTPYSGWFRQGTNIACYDDGDGIIESGELNLYKATEGSYDDWVGVCPVEQSGCTGFIDPSASVSDNLIANPGFEEDYDGNGIPDYYVEEGDGLKEYATTIGVDGSRAVKTVYSGSGANVNTFYQGVTLYAGEIYRLSIKARYADATHTHVIFKIADCTGSGVDFTPLDNYFYTGVWLGNEIIEMQPDVTNNYQEYGGQLTVNQDTTCQVYFGEYNPTGTATGIYFDNLTLKKINPYYYLNNERLDKSTCSGQASLKQGCVLFFDTVEATSTLTYNSAATYQYSSEQNEGLVNPTICSAGDSGCDTNTIMKVIRDRDCAEWYSCVSSIYVQDPANPSALKEQCSQLALCNEYATAAGATGQCANWVIEETPELFTETIYKNRDIGFGGREFSGYSLYNKYPIGNMEGLDVYDPGGTAVEEERFRLVVVVGEGENPFQCGILGQNLGLYSSLSTPTYQYAGQNAPWLIPVAANGLCLLGLDGLGLHCSDQTADPHQCNPTSLGDDDYDFAGDSCGTGTGECLLGEKIQARGYASGDSPFPFGAWNNNKQYYSQANVCIESLISFNGLYNNGDDAQPILAAADISGTGSCEELYNKVEYGNGVKTIYFANGVDFPSSIEDFSGGDTDLGTSGIQGITYQKTKETIYLNWPGYCTENDTSRIVNDGQPACVTWLPQDIVTGGLDIYNQYVEAGYQPASSNEYYCLQAEGNWYGNNPISWSAGGWTPTRYVYSGSTTEEITVHIIPSLGSVEDWLCGVNFGGSSGTEGETDCDVSNNGGLYNAGSNYNWLTATVDQTAHFWVYATPQENFLRDEIEAIEFSWAPLDNAYSGGNNEFYFPIILNRSNNWTCDESNYLTPECYKMTGWTPGVYNSSTDHCNLLEVRASFNNNRYQLLFLTVDDADEGQCNFAIKRVKIYLRENCQVLVKVATNDENKAWTDRTWPGSIYEDKDLENAPPNCSGAYCTQYPNKVNSPFLNYSYNQRNAPSGMSYYYLNSNITPGNYLWNIGDNYSNDNTSNDSLYNAGSPYSCDDNCSGRMCIGGQNDGENCNTSLEDCPGPNSQNPNEGRGICVGLGKNCSGGTNVNNPCNTNTDCPIFGGGYATCGNAGLSATNQTINWAKERLALLFAKSYGAYVWEGNNYQFYPATNSTYNWDITGENNGTWPWGSASNFYHDSPFIFAVDLNGTRVLNPNNIVTINNQFTSNLEASEQLMANIKFYFTSDKNAMPIRNLKIDWGDGSSEIITNGYFQNHLAPDECDGSNFGRLKGQSCAESPYQASHLYSYALAPATGYECPTGVTSDPNAKCFKPKIQITDNWDWCSGSWSYTGSYVGGAYGDTACSNNFNGNNGNFQGWIVVYQ